MPASPTPSPTDSAARDAAPAGRGASAAPSVALDQALVPQVRSMGSGYDAWVHRSIKPQGSLRIFRSDHLERFTHVAWWLVLAVWVPVVVVLWGLALTWQRLPAATTALLALAGVLGWTLLEYVLHRFVFHWRPQGPLGRQFHFLIHGIHHLDPWDATRLVFPPLAGFLVAAPLFGLLWLALPPGPALAVMGGLLSGYMLYDMTHYHVHHRTCRTRWGKFLKKYHLAHHHKHPYAMYGVSSPLWDLVFRTGRPV